MDEYKKIDNSQNYLSQYWDGPENRFIRYFAWFMEGIELMNKGKYLLALFGLGIFKSEIIITWWMLVGGALIGTPILILFGRWQMFKVNKAEQFIRTQHGNVTGWNSYNMQIEALELNKEMLKELKKLNENKL